MFEGLDGFVAAHEERHHHIRKYHYISQGKKRIMSVFLNGKIGRFLSI
jgi:hypothetical protein